MNKTKTGILAITVLSLTATASSVLAQSASSRYSITPEQRSTADQVAQAGVPLDFSGEGGAEEFDLPPAQIGTMTWAVTGDTGGGPQGGKP